MNYNDLTGPDGTEVNMGGTSQIAYFARIDDILTFATPAASPANQYILTVAHVMKTGKKFTKVYITQDTGEVEFGSNGEADGKSFKPVFKFFYPGLTDDALQFVNDSKNDKFLFIVELPDGKMLQIGARNFFATLTGNFKTTTTSGRGRGTEFEVVCFTPYIYRYAAAVPLTPGA
ncbi:hypothetical protein G8759_19960 [Spirosoma aureum]|uniref:Uncharacterized protein n=1 Tax=Spirosoma aureum TaxID=2692134 RepID=A0A6G9AQH6_9BACT|nr:hypothetical protein [Spirosoma aureum]QIP14727.1 hypothetical protein G8759_19960 [Spirosoma aureum]